MLLVPFPRGRHDVFQFRIARLPSKFFERAIGGGHQSRRIARAPRLLDEWNFFLRNFLAHVDDLPHGIAGAVSEIVKTLLAWLQREYVRLREIDDMNVIANAGAVVRRIIRAVNFASLRL